MKWRPHYKHSISFSVSSGCQAELQAIHGSTEVILVQRIRSSTLLLPQGGITFEEFYRWFKDKANTAQKGMDGQHQG